jgi:hypothetical protein
VSNRRRRIIRSTLDEAHATSEVRAMAKGRDRPRKEPKRKAKEKAPKSQAGPVAPSTYQPPMRQVEIIKPKRKEREREPEPQDPIPPDEG